MLLLLKMQEKKLLCLLLMYLTGKMFFENVLKNLLMNMESKLILFISNRDFINGFTLIRFFCIQFYKSIFMKPFILHLIPILFIPIYYIHAQLLAISFR